MLAGASIRVADSTCKLGFDVDPRRPCRGERCPRLSARFPRVVPEFGGCRTAQVDAGQLCVCGAADDHNPAQVDPVGLRRVKPMTVMSRSFSVPAVSWGRADHDVG